VAIEKDDNELLTLEIIHRYVELLDKYFGSVSTLLIPNRTFLVCFGGISGEFGQAMVRILARRSRAKIPMVRPNCLSTCRRSWQASSSLVLAGKIFAPSFDRKTSAKS